MIIKVKRDIAEAIGVKTLQPFGLSEDTWSHRELREIDLADLGPKRIESLRATLNRFRHVHGTGVLVHDIEAWQKALKDSGTGTARTVYQFSVMLHNYLKTVPGHRLYEQFKPGIWLAYYVNEIEYHPEHLRNGYQVPASVEMELVWEMFRGHRKKLEEFYLQDCRKIPVAEVLARRGYYAETPERRAVYVAEVDRFAAVVKEVGRQYWASGTATDDMDGNPKGREESWWWRHVHEIQLELEGNRSRVVVDVFKESNIKEGDDDWDDRASRNVRISRYFWRRPIESEKATRRREDEEIDADAADDADIRDRKEPETIDVPIHPFVAVFDLAKHLRLRIHVNFLEAYEYDRELADRLVLNDDLKSLVEMLVAHRGESFKDLIRGKSGGVVVLLAGPPGTGKTLTAEVYAETESRALYSVQCSQLGTDPRDLEDELLKVFARARRWNAVLLLDEADVYVHQRGRDMMQNAVVGVFLRVLEYQSSVMFMTTNRPDDVDDAIASRCVAKLTYPIPLPAEQAKIWRVLTQTSNALLPEAEIEAIVAANPGITGRDVKNLLKLAMMVRGIKPIRAADVAYVKQFKPTGVVQ